MNYHSLGRFVILFNLHQIPIFQQFTLYELRFTYKNLFSLSAIAKSSALDRSIGYGLGYRLSDSGIKGRRNKYIPD